MSDDLSYSTSKLHELGGELMNGGSAAVRYDPDDVGHRVVHEALEHSCRNWDDRREVLTRSVEAVGALALQSAEVF